MKINVECFNGVQSLTVAEYMAFKLSPGCGGELEQIKSDLENTQRALGRLCEILVEKDLLSFEDLTYVAEDSLTKEEDLVR